MLKSVLAFVFLSTAILNAHASPNEIECFKHTDRELAFVKITRLYQEKADNDYLSLIEIPEKGIDFTASLTNPTPWTKNGNKLGHKEAWEIKNIVVEVMYSEDGDPLEGTLFLPVHYLSEGYKRVEMLCKKVNAKV